MRVTWCLAPGVVYRACTDIGESLVYSGFTGSAHVVANVGSLIVEMCSQGPQTMDSLIAGINDAFEAERSEDLTVAAENAVRQFQDLGILTQCLPP